MRELYSVDFDYERVFREMDGDTTTAQPDPSPASALLRAFQIVTRQAMRGGRDGRGIPTHRRAVAMAWICGAYGALTQRQVAGLERLSLSMLNKTTARIVQELSAMGREMRDNHAPLAIKESFKAVKDERRLAQRQKRLRDHFSESHTPCNICTLQPQKPAITHG